MKAAKQPKKVDKSGKNRKTKRVESYSIYINRVLKQVWRDKIRISKRSMSILNTFMNDIFEKLALEASRLTRYSKKSTLKVRDIKAAVNLLLPGELAKHANSEGMKRVTLWYPHQGADNNMLWRKKLQDEKDEDDSSV